MEEKLKSLEKRGGERNRIEIAPRALLLAVAVILSVLLVSIMLSQFKSAREMANISSEAMNKRTEELINEDILKYDGLTVSGADLINFCKRNIDEVNITLKGASGYTRLLENHDTIATLTDPDESEFVNPVSKWKCSVERNKNGIILGVIFTKK